MRIKSNLIYFDHISFSSQNTWHVIMNLYKDFGRLMNNAIITNTVYKTLHILKPNVPWCPLNLGVISFSAFHHSLITLPLNYCGSMSPKRVGYSSPCLQSVVTPIVFVIAPWFNNLYVLLWISAYAIRLSERKTTRRAYYMKTLVNISI